jgi:acyl-CoA thioester hydrolase
LTTLHLPIALRWGDLDAYGHVNNVAIARLVEEVRIRALWRNPGDDPAELPPTAVLDAANSSDVQSLVARLSIDYLAPMPYVRDELAATLWFEKIGGASVTIVIELASPLTAPERVVYARASTTLVTVSAQTGRPVRIPDDRRAAWGPYVETPANAPTR